VTPLAASPSSLRAVPRRPSRRRALAILGAALAVAAIVAAGVGAVAVSPREVLAILARHLDVDLGTAGARDEVIIATIRAPRVVLAMLVGAALATSGAALQAIARNPLADPGLVGVTGGASLGAVGYLVLGAPFAAAAPALAVWLLPLAAFAGGLIATAAALTIARVDGRTSAVALLLGGLSLGSLCGAATGLLLHVANEAQLRSITFWMLGSLGGASWPVVAAVAAPVLVALVVLPRLAGDLDRLLLGEAEARHLGVDVPRLIAIVATVTSLAVAAAVAMCGAIGFVGLVVPHLLRGWLGPSHRTLIPASMLGGALLLVVADAVARTIVAPAELPIGILTALAGAPVLLALVRRAREALP